MRRRAGPSRAGQVFCCCPLPSEHSSARPASRASVVRRRLGEAVLGDQAPVQRRLLGQEGLHLLPARRGTAVRAGQLLVLCLGDALARDVPDAAVLIKDVLLVLDLPREVALVRDRSGRLQPVEAVQAVPLADAGAAHRALRRSTRRRRSGQRQAAAEDPRAVAMAPARPMALGAGGAALGPVVAAHDLLGAACGRLGLQLDALGRREAVGGHVGQVEPGAVVTVLHHEVAAPALDAVAAAAAANAEDPVRQQAAVAVELAEAVYEVHEGLAVQRLEPARGRRDVDAGEQASVAELPLEVAKPDCCHAS
mmetsp:Transcript_105061/g.318746  ORF Transcript_105061/g.318746 Transcript_105061/m.318746 type:complete len:309 (-) Transcript_105061:746-1672(-)